MLADIDMLRQHGLTIEICLQHPAAKAVKVSTEQLARAPIFERGDNRNAAICPSKPQSWTAKMPRTVPLGVFNRSGRKRLNVHTGLATVSGALSTVHKCPVSRKHMVVACSFCNLTSSFAERVGLDRLVSSVVLL